MEAVAASAFVGGHGIENHSHQGGTVNGAQVLHDDSDEDELPRGRKNKKQATQCQTKRHGGHQPSASMLICQVPTGELDKRGRDATCETDDGKQKGVGAKMQIVEAGKGGGDGLRGEEDDPAYGDE